MSSPFRVPRPQDPPRPFEPFDIPCHRVRLEVELDRLLPFPVPISDRGQRIGGEYRIPVEQLHHLAGLDDRETKEMALEAVLRGLEALVRSTEDKIREAWAMETRSEKSRREHEERRRAATARMFAGDYSQAMAERSKVILYGRTPAETEDYPLGEAPPL